MEPGEKVLAPVLRTKLHPPRVATRVVERPRLFERLDEGAALPLTLVSAPAGYGKSTLVASWLAATDRPGAWLSLDDGDSDLGVFLRYLMAAVETASPEACPQTMALTRVAEPPPATVIADLLSNELDELDDGLTLVLDDYHVIHDVRVHQLLSGLLRHPPRRLHLVVVTRADPPLPLATARRNGVLVEVRANDLQFNTEEADALLTDSLGPAVTRVALSRLLATTEGWPVGLRLAALSLRGQSDPEPMLKKMEGKAMWAGAALVAEVLSTLPSDYQECLLRISLVDRFCARLCESLCTDGGVDRLAGESGEEFLAWLERSDLFIVALDDDREWYRFHHLFRDLLQRRLEDRLPSEAIADLRRAAGTWFESHELLDEALGQYLAGGHATAAAGLVRRHRHDMMNREEWAQLHVWLRRLPADLVESDVELLVQSAWICENRYRYDEMLGLLDKIDRLIAEAGNGGAGDRVLGEIEVLRATRHYFAAEPRAAVAAADRALDAIPADHASQRGFALVLHGFANQMLGEFDHAVEVSLEAMQERRIRGTTLHARILIGLSFIHWMEADLDRMIRFASELLAVGREFALPESVSFARYFLGVAHLDRGDLDEAEAALQPELDQKAPSNATNLWYSAFGLALARDAGGGVERARELAAAMAARALEIQNPALIVLAEAFEAELALRRGELSRAQQWARSFKPASRGTWWRFYLPELTYARVLILTGGAEETRRAEDLLENLHDQLSETHNRRLLLDVELLVALVRHRCGDSAGARAAIEAAVDLARPSGIVRPFRDLAADLIEILDEVPAGSPSRRFLDSAVGQSADRAVEMPVLAQDLDSPTNRELDVLVLLAERLTNKEIAVRLGISPATVKRHLTNLFQKLGVQRRREAVERARKRGLL